MSRFRLKQLIAWKNFKLYRRSPYLFCLEPRRPLKIKCLGECAPLIMLFTWFSECPEPGGKSVNLRSTVSFSFNYYFLSSLLIFVFLSLCLLFLISSFSLFVFLTLSLFLSLSFSAFLSLHLQAFSVLSNRTFCAAGNVLYFHLPMQ